MTKAFIIIVGLCLLVILITGGLLLWRQPAILFSDEPCPSPLVYWSSPKPNPYQWAPLLIVEIGTLSDPDGCRRQRLREHSESHKSRWAMYYSLIPDRFDVDLVDMRTIQSVGTRNQPSVFVGKLYADLTTLTDRGASAEGRIEAQRLLTAEFVWLLRPCEYEAPSPYAQYTTGLVEPAHWKDIP